jgi:hypothetical protein
MTEHEIDQRWPVVAQVVRAIEWHGNPDPEYFCKSFEIEQEHALDRLDSAEVELAALPGARIVEIIGMEADETCDDAPNACLFLSGYFQ